MKQTLQQMLSTGVVIQAKRPPQRWLLALLCLGSLMFSARLSYGQGYIQASTYLGGSGSENSAPITYVVNGETYILGTTPSSDFPVTTGPAYGGGSSDLTVTKLSATGAVVWSRFLGGSGAESSNGIVVSNGSVFILGGTQSTNYPVTNGTAYSSSNSGFYTKLDAVTGAIQFSTYMPGGEFIKVDNGSAYIFRSDGFNGTTFRIYKYDVTTNALLLQKTFNSGSNGNFIRQAEVVDGIIYMAGETYYNNNYYPTTDGTTSGGAYEAFYTKFDGRTGEVLFSTMLNNQCRGPFITFNSLINNASEYFDIKDGGVYFYGYITGCASKFVTTDGSAIPANPWTGFFLRKYDAISNKILYSKIFNLYSGAVRVENGIVYMGNNTKSNDHLAFTKLNAATGAIISSGSLNSNSSEKLLDVQVKNGDLYLLGTTKGDATNTYPVTNGSTKKGAVDSTDYVLTKINAQNQICYSTFLGGNNSEYNGSLLVDNDFAYVTSISRLTDYPVTNSSSNKGAYDFVWTKFNINPASNFSGDNLTPASQTVCKNNSSVATLSGPAFSISGNSLPNLYRQGVAESQTTIAMMYQWQQALSASGPWSDIPGAIKVNYTPLHAEGVTTYYRRLTTNCDSVLSTSSIATVAVNANTAPTINVGSVVNTCLGSTTRLGGSPTATGNGGATIASYQWTPAGVYTPNNASANPTVSPTTTTIYTVLVTDNNGCQSLGQQLVNVYKADAGPDASTCVGKIVRIGGAPIQGLSGLTYSWSASPADPSMSCTNCAQPDVHPTAATTYTLTMTIPVTGGGTCSTTDVVTVTPVAAPVTPNFAGPDKTFCISDLDAFLGTPKESGFTYVWAPGNYLQWNNVSSTRFQPGNLAMPNPNPIKYYLTAIKQGCSFVDSTYASVIEANAGVDGCGPRYVGTADRTPNINETYSWTKVSGPGNFTGATNLPMVPVSSSGGGSTTYRLTVSYNGTTCTDDVVVPPCGCVVDIAVEAPFVCPSFGLNGGANSVKLTATAGDIFSSDPSVFTYTWSPNVGLSAYSGREVYLTDNVERTYTVTMGSPFDPSFNCTRTIHVNNPAWSLPVFQAKDVTTCPGISVSIGQPTVAGYSYAWTDPQKYLNDTTLSNPTAIVRGSQYFPVLVVDVGSGCVARDTAHVIITGMPAGIAGSDIQMCGSGTVQLGQSPLPNVTYLWTPAASYQPNNTAANPTIPVAATTSFYLQATNSVTGCVVNDTVKVTVKSPVAPFSFTNQTYCPSTSGAMPLPAGPSGMASYSWSPASLVVNPKSNGPTATTQSTRPASATTFTLTVTNAAGCTGSANVTFTPSVIVPTAGDNKSICLGSTVQLGGPSAGGTYAWTSSPASGVTGLSSAVVSNPVFNPTAAGTYVFTVTRTDPGGCRTTANVTITVNTFTLTNVMPSPTVCQNSCVQIGTNDVVSGTQYYWNPSTGLSDPAIPNPYACVGNTSQTYTLTGIGANGCQASQTIVVGVNPTPAPSVTIPDVTACLADSKAMFSPSVSPSGTYNYQWSPNDGTLNNIYAATPTVILTGTGTKTYNLIVTNTSTGCATTASGRLNVNICNTPSCVPPSGVSALPKLQTICEGGPAGAYIASPATGVEYQWYGPLTDTTSSLGTGIGGATSASYTPSGTALTTAGTKYYAVRVSNAGDATCSDTAYVRLVVNAKPAIANGTAAICSGESVDLTSKIASYATYQSPVWSIGTAGGTAVTNPTVVKPTATTTYILVAQNATGCKDTAQVVVTVNAKPIAGTDQNICSPATTASLTGFSPAGGTWSAQTGNPAAAAVTNAGAVSGMSAVGTYKFIYSLNGCSDTVSVIIKPKPVAGTDQSICSPATTTSLTGFSPAGGTWSAQTGNPAAAIVTNAGAVSGMSAAGTYKFIYSLNGCADTVSVIINAKPVAGADQSLACANASTNTLQTTTSLTGFSPAGGTWSAMAGNPATATVTNAGSVSGMNVAGVYQFIYTVNGCSDTVRVTVQACAGCTKPIAGTDQSLCSPMSTTNLTGFSPAGGTWSAQTGNPAGATVTNAGAVTGMSVVGTYRFIYSVTSGGQTCSDTVSVIIKPKPVAGADQSICSPATTTSLTGFSPAGGTWSAQTGNPAAATVTNAGAVSGMSAAGTYKFIYSLNGCSDTVSVIINAKPVAGTDQTLTSPTSTTSLTGFSPAGGTWSAMAGNPATATVTNAGAVTGMSAVGTYRFIYSITANGVACSDTVAVTINVKPSAGLDQSLCSPMSTTNLTGFSPAGGTWTAQTGNPAAATVTNAGAVSGMSAAGTYRFIYSVPNNGSDTVSVIIKPKPVAGTDQNICAPATTTSLTGFSPAGGTWSAQTGNPAAATVTNAGAVSGMSAVGTYKFIYSLNGCSDTVSVIIKPKPVAGTDQNICAPATTTSLTGFSPAGGTWSAQTGNPAAATVTNAGAVSGMSAVGTYKFIYSLNGCSDTVSVIIKPKPVAGTDQSICSPATTTSLTGFSPAGGTWSAQTGNPASATVTNAGAVSGMSAAGTYKFIYSLNGCSDTISVIINAKPVAGADQSLACANASTNTLQTTTTLTGFSPAGGAWSAMGGNPATAAVTNAGAVSGMNVAGVYQFIYTVNGCSDTVRVTVQACVGCTKPSAGADQSLCSPATTTSLTGFSPAGGTWTAQTGNPAGATVTNAGAVTGMSVVGTYRFIYSVTSGGQTCSDTVSVIIKPKPVAGTDQSLCSPATTTSLTGFSPAGGTWSAQTGNPASAIVTNAGAVSGMSAVGTYKFIYSLNGCSDTVSVIINAKPVAGADQSLACANASTNTLQTTTTLTGFSPAGGAWSAMGGNPATAAVTNAGAVSGMNVAGVYQFIYTANGCSDTVRVTVQACAGCTKPSAGADQSLCSPMSTTNLTGFSPAGGTWSAQTGNPAGATVTNAGLVSGMSVVGTYRFIYSVTSGGQTCSDTVSVIIRPKPVAGTDQSLCSPATTTSLTGFSPAGGTWSAQTGNPAAATVTNGGAVSGMSAAGTYKFIYTLNGCADTVSVIIKPKPVAGTDQTLTCTSGSITSTSLTGFSPAGGTWSAMAGNPATAAVTNAGAVSGMSVAGTYKFIYSLNGCADTVSVQVPSCSFDLALRKVLPSGSKNPTVAPGDTVTFNVVVYNQGNVDATNVRLVDYIPAGLTLADANWTASGSNATLNTPIASLAAGASVTRPIRFVVNAGFTGSIRNFAEISGAENAKNLDDIDSTPDSNPSNDGTPKDDVINEDHKNNPGQDEDDSDYEDITVSPKPVFDLALRKVLPSGSKNPTVAPGDTVTFNVVVYNQGNVDATNVSLVDYIPAGLTLADANWTASGSNATLNTPIASLAAGASVTRPIRFVVNAGFTGSIRNFAEISGAQNANNLDDIDSTPDSNPNNDGTPKDDVINEDHKNNPGQDEDDSDYEDITVSPKPVFDLAMRKVLPSGSKNPTVSPGDTVTFNVVVYNQGNVDATNVRLVDYIPAGLTLADANWTASGNNATLNTPIASLAAGASVTRPIRFVVNAGFTGSIRNFAEISGAENAKNLDDIDSTPDSNPSNDGTPKDDVINEDHKNNPTQDEDDSDYEDITVSPKPVFDLGLRKVLPSGSKNPTVAPGDTVTFNVVVYNQGNVDATNVRLVDYIPAGLTLADANWTASGNNATLNTPIASLAAGASVTRPIRFVVNAGFTGSIRNFAEISGAENAKNLDDIDSTPDSNPNNDGTPKDDVINEDHKNNPGQDEDDSDYEDITVSPKPVFDLAMRKVLPSGAKNPTVAPGDTVTFNVVVYNQGNVDATNVRLVDYIPAGLTLADASWTASGSNATLNTPIASLAAGASVTRPIRFVVNAGFTGSIRNFAEISGAQNAKNLDDIDSTPDSNPSNDGTPKDDVINEDHKNNPTQDEDDSDYEDITVSPKPVFDLAMRKVLPSGSKNPTVAPGDTVTFNVVVYNQGNVDATNVRLVDYIPAGLTLADANWTASGSNATLNTPIASLAAGASVTRPIRFVVNAGFTGSIRNFAEISGAQNANNLDDIDSTPDSNPNNDGTPKDDVINEDHKNNPGQDEDDSDYEDITVSPKPVFDLALRKVLPSGSKNPTVAPGDTVTFNVVVYNQGNVDATNVSLVDYIPAGLTLADANWTASGSNATLNTPIASLAAGASVTRPIRFVVNAGFTGSIRNFAEISGAQNAKNLDDIDSTPDSNPSNDGTPKDDVINEDHKNNPTQDEDDADYEDITVAPKPVFDLGLRKVLPSGSKNPTVAPGDTVTFNVVVYNQGNVDATNVRLVDYIPAGLTLADANWTASGSNATLNTPIASLAAGASVTRPIRFVVNAGFTGSIRNFAEISGAQNANNLDDIDSTPDSNPNNDGTPKDDVINEDHKNNPGQDEDDSDYEDITVSPKPVFDLGLRKVLPSGAKNPTVAPGDTVTFNVVVYNQGNVDATNVRLVDYIPAGLTLADGNWTASGSNATLNTPIASLAAGSSVTRPIRFVVNAGFTGSIRNFAEISGAQNANNLDDIDSTPDSNPSNDGTPKDDVINEDHKNNPTQDEDDSDYEDITVSPKPVFDLAMRKVLPSGSKNPTVAPGDTVTFNVVVYNQGNVDATNVRLVDYIPAGLTLADANWTASGSNATLNTPIASLAAGASVTRPIRFVVNAGFTGSIRNFAEISGAQNANNLDDIDSTPDSNPNNDGTPKDDVINEDHKNNPTQDEDDSDIEVINVGSNTVDLALKKEINKKIARLGETVTYTLKVWNESAVSATGVVARDSLPAGVEYLNSSASRGSYDPSSGLWTIGNVGANGDTVTVTIQVKVVAEGIWFNTAEIFKSDQTDKDSTPGNGVEGEDDMGRQCFTVPIKLCPQGNVQIIVPAENNVQWFKDGGSTPVASGNTVRLNEPGIYTFHSSAGNCPAEGCCPVIIEADNNCCKDEICVPFTIQKRKKN